MNPEGLYFTCPVCGADVPRKAKSCPDCGACEKSGWSDEARYDGLNLPDQNFDYEKFTADEFGSPRRKSSRDLLWWLVAIIVLTAFAWLTVRGRF